MVTPLSVEDLTPTPVEAEWEWPSYKTPGNITVEILQKIDISYHPGWEWEVGDYTYDCNSAAFYINEGMGMDYFVNDMLGEEITGPGFWTIANITGSYIKGDWGFTDDDEEFEWEEIRPATQDEIDSI